MSEHGTVERVVKELRALQKWHSAETLAKEVVCSLPTATKDIQELERLGLVVKREGKRKGTRGKVPSECKLKAEERNILKFRDNLLIDFLLIIQALDENKILGLTVAELSKEADVPTNNCFKIVSLLKAMKWVYKRGVGPKTKQPYKPRYRITMLGE